MLKQRRDDTLSEKTVHPFNTHNIYTKLMNVAKLYIFYLMCRSPWIEISLWNYKYVITQFKYVARDAINFGEAGLLSVATRHKHVSFVICSAYTLSSARCTEVVFYFSYGLRWSIETLQNPNSFLFWPPCSRVEPCALFCVTNWVCKVFWECLCCAGWQ